MSADEFTRLRAENADHLLRADLLRARIVELENECDHAGNILGRIGALLDDYEHINVPDPADLDDEDAQTGQEAGRTPTSTPSTAETGTQATPDPQSALKSRASVFTPNQSGDTK